MTNKSTNIKHKQTKHKYENNNKCKQTNENGINNNSDKTCKKTATNVSKAMNKT